MYSRLFYVKNKIKHVSHISEKINSEWLKFKTKCRKKIISAMFNLNKRFIKFKFASVNPFHFSWEYIAHAHLEIKVIKSSQICFCSRAD